jgi:ABC-type bacteriocin/lantibiotic exporter with double-glycine peptidase domain
MTRTLHALHVPVIGQASSFACGNTSLAAVVQYFGKPFSPAELAVLANTTKDGTDHATLVAGAVATGATVFAKAKGTLGELAGFVSRGLPVIVGWWSMGPGDAHFDKAWTLGQRKQRDCGHFSVIRGTTPGGFLVMDPQHGDDERTIGYCEKPAKAFEAVWYDTDGPAYEKVTRWYMVLNYAGRLFAKEHGGEDHRPKR